jgi:hypothetical protein
VVPNSEAAELDMRSAFCGVRWLEMLERKALDPCPIVRLKNSSVGKRKRSSRARGLGWRKVYEQTPSPLSQRCAYNQPLVMHRPSFISSSLPDLQ